MSILALSFLGTVDVTRDGVPVTHFRSDKQAHVQVLSALHTPVSHELA
jgi:hypothetical protein